jgi:FkbM family methyltransferase
VPPPGRYTAPGILVGARVTHRFADILYRIANRYVFPDTRIYGAYNRLRYSGDGEIARIFGVDLSVVPRREPAYHVAATRLRRNQILNHEAPEIIAVAALLRPGTTFVDCGANVGLWSLSIGRLHPVLPGLTVLSFEANPDTFARLQKGCRAYPNIACVNVALSDRDGELEMREGGSSLIFGVAGGWNKGGRRRLVRCARLDPYLEGHDDIVLKIDVEGHEWPVMLGAQKALREARVRAVLIDGEEKDDEARIRDCLASFGFTTIDAERLTPYRGGTGPILAVRRP